MTKVKKSNSFSFKSTFTLFPAHAINRPINNHQFLQSPDKLKTQLVNPLEMNLNKECC